MDGTLLVDGAGLNSGASLMGVGKPVKAPADYLRELLEAGSAKPPPLFAVAVGRKDGRPAAAAASVLSAPAAGMGGATGVPLAVGLAVVRPDRERPRGVFAPEAIVDPVEFFDRLAPLCDPAKRAAADLVLISRSWEPQDLRAGIRSLAS